MSNWLDNSNNANTLKSSYIEGFVDVSGGSIQIRNQSNKLSIQGDASFSNNVYLANTTKIGKRFERNVTSTTTKSLDVSGNVQISNGELITTGNTTIYNNARVNNLNVSGEFKNDNLPTVSGSDVTFNETINNTFKMAVNTSDTNFFYAAEELTEPINLTTDSTFTSFSDYQAPRAALSSNGLVVVWGVTGVRGDNDKEGAGKVSAYRRDSLESTTWTEVTIYSGTSSNEGVGRTVSISSDGSRILVNCRNSFSNEGNIQVYEYDNNNNSYANIYEVTGDFSNSQLGYGNIKISPDGNKIAYFKRPDSNDTTKSQITIQEYNGTDWTSNTSTIDIAESANYYIGAMSDDFNTLYLYRAYSETTNRSFKIYYYGSGAWINTATIEVAATTYNSIYYSNEFKAISKNGNYIVYNNTVYKGSADRTSWSVVGNADIDVGYNSLNYDWFPQINDYGNVLIMSEYDDQGAIIFVLENNVWVQKSVIANSMNFSSSSFHTINNNYYIPTMSGTTVTINKAPYEFIEGDPTLNISDVDDSGTFSSDVSLNNSLKVPGNILIVDSSNSTYNYGAYTVYTTADNTNYFAMGKDASNVFNIVNNNHAGVYMSSGSNAFTSTSDERLKKNIEELDEEECVQKLKQLEPVTYQWKHNENGEKQAGFIAQEVEKVFPDLVSENTYPDGSTYKGVAMDDLIPYLLKYIQYLRKKLETIKANRSEHASISTNGGSITPLTSTDDLTRA